MTYTSVTIATNNGDIGGGEVMLLALARQLVQLGVPLQVIAPEGPSALVDEARREGYKTVALRASTRRGYMRRLRRWRRRHTEGLLWCNGLVPALATTGLPDRVVHLHQVPSPRYAALARLARAGAVATVVPSHFVREHVRGSRVLENWVEEVPGAQSRASNDVIRLGYLGRLSLEKGLHVLADALAQLDANQPGRYRLVIAGEPRFVNRGEQLAVGKALAPIAGLVDMPGWMLPSDFFPSVDMLVCPSVTPEAFGLVAGEAMSARVPFVVSDAGSLPEVAGPDYPWVARAGDAESLANTIRDAVSGDQTATVAQAYARWKHQFSPAAGKARLSALLELIGVITKPQGRGM
jgi:glycosyltransferase involved in cell wall biosynthesis